MSEDQAHHYTAVVAIVVSLMLLTSAAVWMRVHSRLITKSFAIDDWFLVLTVAVHLPSSASYVYIEIEKWYMPMDSTEMFDKLGPVFVFQLFAYLFCAVTLKFSLMFFFLKITRNKPQRRIVVATATIQLILFSADLLANTFRCGKISPKEILGNSHCFLTNRTLDPLDYIMVITNAICDWIFALVPVHMVYEARSMSRGSRLAVCFLISLAIAGGTISLVRLGFVGDLHFGPTFFAHETPISAMCNAELHLGIISISLAGTGTLWQAWGRKLNIVVSRLGRKFKTSGDSEKLPIAAKPVAPYQSTVNYQDMLLDMDALRGIGILPDVPISGSYSAEKKRTRKGKKKTKLDALASTVDSSTTLSSNDSDSQSEITCSSNTNGSPLQMTFSNPTGRNLTMMSILEVAAQEEV